MCVCVRACQAGWMMWNWYVTSLAIGSAIVCYDGSPFVPHDSVLFDLVDEIGSAALLLCVLFISLSNLSFAGLAVFVENVSS